MTRNAKRQQPVADTLHDNLVDAIVEAARRRSELHGKEFVTRVEPSRCGGYRVRSLPTEFYVEQS